MRASTSTLFALAFLAATAAQASVSFQNKGSKVGWSNYPQTPVHGNITDVTSPAYQGGTAIRFYQPFEGLGQDTGTYHCEVVQSPTCPVGTTAYYGFTLYLPTDYVWSPDQDMCFSQWARSDQSASPWTLMFIHNHEIKTGGSGGLGRSWGTIPNSGVWTRVVVKITNKSSGGEFTVWINGVQNAASFTGNITPGGPSLRWSTGQYCTWWKTHFPNGSNPMITYEDHFRIATTFAEAEPANWNENPPPDFTISATPSSRTVTAGSGTTYTVNVGALNGFNGSVSLTASGLPSGAGASFNPASVTASGSATLNLSTASSTPAGTYTVTINGTSGSLSHSTPVTLTVNPVSCKLVAATGVWTNSAMTSQSGTFTASFDATPSISPISAAVGLSKGAQNAFSGFACLPIFTTSGLIQARNGGVYAADSTIPYSAGVTYHFRLVVNVAAHTYSTYVTPAGGSEIPVGINYAFRTEQNAVTSLDSWAALVNTSPGGTLNVCGFSVGP